jgi:hypothetical protein
LILVGNHNISIRCKIGSDRSWEIHSRHRPPLLSLSQIWFEVRYKFGWKTIYWCSWSRKIHNSWSHNRNLLQFNRLERNYRSLHMSPGMVLLLIVDIAPLPINAYLVSSSGAHILELSGNCPNASTAGITWSSNLLEHDKSSHKLPCWAWLVALMKMKRLTSIL